MERMAQESLNIGPAGTGCEASEGIKLYVNNCVFFRSSATSNLCSKYYRDIILKKHNKNIGHVSVGDGRMRKDKKHPRGRDNDRGMHHHHILFHKCQLGYFGKVN
ncbi:hypothetical protein KI387_001193, partial [Taxus chinensis]